MLKELIAEKGLRQGWIAARLGMPHNTFSQVVRGKTRLAVEKIRPLSVILGVSVEAIVDSVSAPFIDHDDPKEHPNGKETQG